MSDLWFFQPYGAISKPGEIFNLSSPNAIINIISVIFFSIIAIIKKIMPEKKLNEIIIMTIIFLIILTSFLKDDFLKPPSGERKIESNPFDFSRTKEEESIIYLS